jgi:hypothetical protein
VGLHGLIECGPRARLGGGGRQVGASEGWGGARGRGAGKCARRAAAAAAFQPARWRRKALQRAARRARASSGGPSWAVMEVSLPLSPPPPLPPQAPPGPPPHLDVPQSLHQRQRPGLRLARQEPRQGLGAAGVEPGPAAAAAATAAAAAGTGDGAAAAGAGVAGAAALARAGHRITRRLGHRCQCALCKWQGGGRGPSGFVDDGQERSIVPAASAACLLQEEQRAAQRSAAPASQTAPFSSQGRRSRAPASSTETSGPQAAAAGGLSPRPGPAKGRGQAARSWRGAAAALCPHWGVTQLFDHYSLQSDQVQGSRSASGWLRDQGVV